MIRYFFVFIFLMCFTNLKAQDIITANELLEKSINFHDPQNKWKTFSGKMLIEMETPSSSLRRTILEMDFTKQYFKSSVTKDNYTVESELNKGKCTLKLNGSTSIFPKIKDSLRITCDRAKFMKNYYQYLYGLPMKLKDKGTNLNPVVRTKTFMEKEYLVLKATYEQTIGKDTWYFYFDPSTYAMEAYQFFHDESKNDGEYILLSEIENVGSIKMPKVRTWYYNKDDKLLGTDILQKGSTLN
jgi:hypothetical protein